MVDNPINIDMNDQRYAVLTFEQVQKLNNVLQEVFPIHGRGNFPTLDVRLTDLITNVRSKLREDSINVKDIRMNGSTASYILSGDEEQSYNDLDLIFLVELKTQRCYERVKTAVLDALLDFLPEGVSKKRMSSCSMKEGYVNKMVKVNDSDRWSLISLSNGGRNVELKFVDTMKRQFEFSVDSFQIVLDSILLFYDCAEMPMSDNFYPTVIGESVYGDFPEALYHLQKKLIDTKNPEEIRGGGLLKYCYLVLKDYKPANPENIKTLERYMCSRFFIDFSDISQQQNKLEAYLWNHFVGPEEEALRYNYLTLLQRVVDKSTVCLMGHERRQTLNLIGELAYQVYAEQQMMYRKQQQQCSSPASSCSSMSSSSSSNSSSSPSSSPRSTGSYDLQVTPPPPVIYSNGYYYAPIVPAPPPSYTCTCGWLQCA